MIDLGIVNGVINAPIIHDPIYEFTKSLDAIFTDIDNDIRAYEELCESVGFEEYVFGEAEKSSDDKSSNKQSEKSEKISKARTNIFAKIGNAIMEVIKKFFDWSNKFALKLKNFSFKNKTNTQKVEALIKKHPELKQEIIDNAPDLSLSDIKSLSELDKEFDQLMTYSDKLDETEFKRKSRELMEKYDKKVEKANSRVHNTVRLVEGVAALVTLPLIISKAHKAAVDSANRDRKACDEIRRNIRESQTYNNRVNNYQRAHDDWEQNYRMGNEPTPPRRPFDRTNQNDNTNFNSFGFLRMKLELFRWKNAKTVTVLSNNYNRVERLFNSITTVIDNVVDRNHNRANRYRDNSQAFTAYGNEQNDYNYRHNTSGNNNP